MVLVCHPHKFIYLKTFKTAGTSTEMALEVFCTPEGHTPEHDSPAIISDQGIVGARTFFISKDKTGWTSHAPARRVRRKLGADTFEAYHKVASIRNPFDKAVSWYFFAKSREVSKTGFAAQVVKSHLPGSQKEIIEDFRAFVKQNARDGFFSRKKNIDWRTTHFRRKLVIDSFLRLEHLQDDLAKLSEKLGLDRSRIHMASTKRKSRTIDKAPVPDYFDKKTANIIRKHQEWMFEAGGYSLDPRDADRASKETIK